MPEGVLLIQRRQAHERRKVGVGIGGTDFHGNDKDCIATEIVECDDLRSVACGSKMFLEWQRIRRQPRQPRCIYRNILEGQVPGWRGNRRCFPVAGLVRNPADTVTKKLAEFAGVAKTCQDGLPGHYLVAMQ